jgi:hypothetical protein
MVSPRFFQVPVLLLSPLCPLTESVYNYCSR